jgi:hypothetical protein
MRLIRKRCYRSASAEPDTMQFHYDVQHTSNYSPVAGSTPSNGKLKWNYTTEAAMYSSPAVVNGVVYVASGDNIVYAIADKTKGLCFKQLSYRRSILWLDFAPSVARSCG